MVERGEFELPVPISEQPDDNVMSGPRRPDEVSGSSEAQTRLIRSATFEEDRPLVRDERHCDRCRGTDQNRAGHFVPVALSDLKRTRMHRGR
jgi:hypothetical protein